MSIQLKNYRNQILTGSIVVLWLTPSLFDTRDWFGRRQFSHGGWGAGVGGFRMIQAYHIYYACVLSRVWLFATPWTVA